MRHRFPAARKFLILTGDIVCFIVSIQLACRFLPELLNSSALPETAYVELLFVGAIIEILYAVNDLFSLQQSDLTDILLSLSSVGFCVVIVIMALGWIFVTAYFSLPLLLTTLALQIVFSGLWRCCIWRMEHALWRKRQTLLIGDNATCARLLSRMQLCSNVDLQLKYVCTDWQRDDWQSVFDEIDLVILSADLPREAITVLLNCCNARGKEVCLLPTFYDLFCHAAQLGVIGDCLTFRLQMLTPTLEQRAVKRFLDLIIAGTALLFGLPLFGLIALAIRFNDTGPAIYSQVRMGKNEKNFEIYKFRTMRTDAEKYSGPVLAGANDSRITQVGKFLRATRLDELPQLWNVLVGDMSIVGPRPERPYFIEQFKRQIPEYAYRHKVKPGITGLAQIRGKYHTLPHDKLVYDLLYIQKCNILTDWIIMLQTIKILVTKSAAEGAAATQKNVDLDTYRIRNSYGNL